MLTSHKLPSVLFELVLEIKVDASWGDVTSRIYRRKFKTPKWIAGIIGRK